MEVSLVKIESMTMINFKSFKEISYDFDKQFTLIIGNNGVGKTSILEGLSIVLGGFLAGIDGIDSRNIRLDEVRKSENKVGDATYTIEPQFPCIVEAKGTLLDENITWERSINNKKGRTTRVHAKELIKEVHRLSLEITKENSTEVVLPLLSYQSAGRLYSQKREKWLNPFSKSELSRFMGYTDCLAAESNIKLFVNWFRRMSLIEIQKKREIGELKAVLYSINKFMSYMLDSDVTIYYDFETEEVIVCKNKEEIPLRLMSSGYRTLIGMIADLSYRAALLNPQLKEKAVDQTPGVVLIDEIDLHLHPNWQWEIIEALKVVFPKVQFIATTHSPIIMSSFEYGYIIDLNKQHTIQNTFGWKVGDILEGIMNSSLRDPKVANLIEKVEMLYSKKFNEGLSMKDKNDLKEAENTLYQTLPEQDPAVTLAKLNSIEKELEDTDK